MKEKSYFEIRNAAYLLISSQEHLTFQLYVPIGTVLVIKYNESLSVNLKLNTGITKFPIFPYSTFNIRVKVVKSIQSHYEVS